MIEFATYWFGRLVCRLFGRHNVSCRGRRACADKLWPSRPSTDTEESTDP